MGAGMKPFTLVVAASKNLGIGRNNQLPWKLPGDMAYFKKVTSQTSGEGKKNVVVMGRKTWESIPPKFRPLPNRLNVVLSRSSRVREDCAIPAEVLVATSYEDLSNQLSSPTLANLVDNIFVIGGQSVFKEALEYCRNSRILLTRIDADIDCDVFFPDPEKLGFEEVNSSEWMEENGLRYRFTELDKKKRTVQDGAGLEKGGPSAKGRHEEYQYLDLIRDIIERGHTRVDRTGTGTKSLFGVQMRYSLRDNIFPLLTTKRVFWRGVAEELLWFISGCTNAKVLQEKNIRIWDGNASREYLDSLGHTQREEGDLGPVYGFQWRHFGAKYVDMHTDYTGQGVDQLAEAIHKLKTSPHDRRIIVSAWNPADLSQMALPPCHMFCQFYVADGELSCQMYQRSADMGLGVPFNIASYSLLVRLVAQVCDLKPGDFVHVIGDAHVYMDHIEPLREQLRREPTAFPKLYINPEKKDIDSFVYDDFTLKDYSPAAAIKMKMSV